MSKIKDLHQPAASQRRRKESKTLKTTKGGGSMYARKLCIAITTLFILVAAFVSPSVEKPVMAQQSFPNCIDGVCKFPIERTWSNDCEFNIRRTLEMVGQGQNYWLIPKGGVPQSFIEMAGSMDSSSGYRDIWLKESGNVPGRCACDVASMFYITGLANGLSGDPDTVNHYAFPGVSDKTYSVMIYNYGDGNPSNSDLRMSNPSTTKDAVYKWKEEYGNIVMWVEVDGAIPTPLTPGVNTPEPEITLPILDNLPKIIDETDEVKKICPKMNTSKINADYSKGTVIHHTAGGDWRAAVSGHCKDPYPPYSFVVSKDGTIHQLVEWKGHVWATGGKNYNIEYVAVSLHGNFEVEEPTEEQVESLIRLLRWFWSQGVPRLVTTHEELGSEAGYGTVCPGENLKAILPEIVEVAEKGFSSVSTTSLSVTDSNEVLISGSTRDLYRSMFVGKDPVLELLIQTDIVDEDTLILYAVWTVRAIVVFVLLFFYLILRWIVNKGSAGGKWITRRAGQRSYQVYVPRSYFNGLSWFLLVVLLPVIYYTKDEIYRSNSFHVWWVLFGMTVFFWFAKRGDYYQHRDGKTGSETGKFIWDWTIGSVTFVLAAYLWGITVGLGVYAFNGMLDKNGSNVTPYPWTHPEDLPNIPVNWVTPLLNVPDAFASQVRDMGVEVAQIAREEGVPAETPFVLWLKESGGRMVNPGNGEGLCGFHDLVVSGQDYFTPGPISREEALRQLRLCAREFKKRSAPFNITFETTNFDLLGPVYMRYNGNIDCHGGAFASYKQHPYVMNGYDSKHQGMVARDGKGGCVALKIIGAVPAHIRIASLLRPIDVPNVPTLPLLPNDPTLIDFCKDELEPCGFALKGGSSMWTQGTNGPGGNGGLGFHENAWDWWFPGEESTRGITPPTEVISMLNGKVTEIGRFNNGGLNGGTTYMKVSNGRWTQVIYHCDDIYADPGEVTDRTKYVTLNQTVVWGAPLCQMGNQGTSAWTHLHLQLIGPSGSVVDQTQWEPKLP